MATLRLENDDPRITYGPPSLRWTTQELISADGERVTVRSTAPDTRFSRILLLFRGTGFKFYGGGTGDVWLSFDDEPRRSVQIPTLPGSAPLVDVTGLEDTDHQFFVLGSGEIWVDHYELESSTGEGFEPINAGLNATSVPLEAITIEDTSSKFELQPRENWGYDKDEIYSANSQVRANITGSILTYRFNGTAIWMFGDKGHNHGTRLVTLDDETPEEFSTRTPGGGQLMQTLLWQKTDLEPGEHTLRMEMDGHGGIDFLKILRNEDASTISSPSQTGEPSAGGLDDLLDDNKMKGLAIGVTIGAVTLLGLITFLLWRLLQRRRAMSNVSVESPYQIFSPPLGPPPKTNQTDLQEHEAERPSFEETPLLSRKSNNPNTTQTMGSVTLHVGDSHPSSQQVLTPSVIHNTFIPELPYRKPRH